MLYFSHILKLTLFLSFILHPTFASDKQIENDEDKVIYNLIPSLPQDIQQRIVEYFDYNTYLNIAGTSKYYRKNTILPQIETHPLLISQIETQPLYIVPYSSVISRDSIRSNIFKHVKLANQRIIVTSDQFTDFELVDYLIEAKRKGIQVEILVGENPYFSISLEKKLKDENIVYQSKKFSGKGKMHNKFILIDDYGTLLGSPNATTSAFDTNIESMVAIYNKKVNDLYKDYYDYIKTSDFHKEVKLNTKLKEFNGLKECPIKICLAPMINIAFFVNNYIKDSEIIAINMFLIGQASNTASHDIVTNLKKVAQDGSPILLKIDGEQYLQQDYVKRALTPLKNIKNIQISAVYPLRGVFHDKLIIFKKENKLYTILGSAGFTNNVQDNINEENMICIESSLIQKFYRRHFSALKEGHPKVRKIEELQ